MPVVNLSKGSGQSLFEPGYGSVLIVNNSEAETIWIGPQSAVTASDIPIAPQASVTLDGTVRWYGSTVADAGVVEVLVLPGGTDWQNPVGVEIALSSLGLATADLQTSQLNVGIPPNVPNIQAASTINGEVADSPFTVYTMPADGRLWGVNMSGSCSASPTYSAGAERFFWQAQADSDIVLAIIEQSLNGAGQAQSDSIYIPFNGLAVAEGIPLIFIINSGASIPEVAIIGSIVFFYSIP